jgi:hypothetical protein
MRTEAALDSEEAINLIAVFQAGLGVRTINQDADVKNPPVAPLHLWHGQSSQKERHSERSPEHLASVDWRGVAERAQKVS